jgi:hypothetical protein
MRPAISKPVGKGCRESVSASEGAVDVMHHHLVYILLALYTDSVYKAR